MESDEQEAKNPGKSRKMRQLRGNQQCFRAVREESWSDSAANTTRAQKYFFSKKQNILFSVIRIYNTINL